MIIPTKKEYTSIQQLKVLIKMIADDLDLVFKFKLKKISFEGGGMKTEDKNLTVKKSFSPKDYLIYGDSFNQEKIFNSLKEIIEEVKVKPLV
jgi:hypothetical protein